MGEAEQKRPVDEAGVEEDFLYHLYRGGELLGAGKNPEARDELEKAFHLKPQNAKAQNLLGLVYFKLGELVRSTEIYEMLVEDNPTDPTLRVNLGLVHIKAGLLDKAIRELETAVDLSPDRQKPLNYLGLAYTQARMHAKALSAFQRAGNTAMAEKMQQALATAVTDPASRPRDRSSEEESLKVRVKSETRYAADIVAAGDPVPLPGDSPHARVVASSQEVDVEGIKEDDGVEIDLGESGGPARAKAAPPAPAPATVREPPRARVPETQAASTMPAGGLGDLLKSAQPAHGDGTPFQIGAEGTLLRVHGQLHARLTGLCWMRGELARAPEQKRFRGRATDKPFGEGVDRLYTLTGEGEVFVAIPGLTAVELGEEAVYLLEEAVFAFEDSLAFENGRVSSPQPPDLFLVHLRGEGKVLLRPGGKLQSLPLRTGEPLILPMDRLVGWTGGLTPSVLGNLASASPVAGGASEPEMGRFLRLEGDGWALWNLPPT